MFYRLLKRGVEETPPPERLFTKNPPVFELILSGRTPGQDEAEMLK
jgi:hypothetical protein